MELILDSFVHYEGKGAEVINALKSAGAAARRAPRRINRNHVIQVLLL